MLDPPRNWNLIGLGRRLRSRGVFDLVQQFSVFCFVHIVRYLASCKQSCWGRTLQPPGYAPASVYFTFFLKCIGWPMGRQARNWPRLHAPGRHLFHASLAACGHGLRRLPAALSAKCLCVYVP